MVGAPTAPGGWCGPLPDSHVSSRSRRFSLLSWLLLNTSLLKVLNVPHILMVENGDYYG
jgi:hypothetical protein